MLRTALLALLLVASFSCGCSNDSIADKEGKAVTVLIASNPPGATIMMQGAPIGKTPMGITVRQTTPVNLKLQGYKGQQVFVDPSGPLNLVFSLEPLPKIVQEQKTEEPTPPAARKAEPAKQRQTFKSLKENYRRGEIDKVEYSRQVTKLKHKMKTELNNLKQSYRRGDIDKIEYRQQAQKIKYRYKG